MSALRLYSLVIGGVVVAAAGAVCLFGGRRKSPEQRERERREWLSSIGRITDGTVLDMQEIPQEGRGPIQLLIYQYNISGVDYECSQDITYLRQFVDVHSCRLGLPVSVKYDPRNPGNSVVISESWTGLRDWAELAAARRSFRPAPEVAVPSRPSPSPDSSESRPAETIAADAPSNGATSPV